MSDASQDQPSIEEILASIRKIISDEDEAGQGATADSAVVSDSAPPVATSNSQDDIDALFDDSPVMPAPAPVPVKTHMPEPEADILDLTEDEMFEEPVFVPEPTPQPAPVFAPLQPPPVSSHHASDDEKLLSEPANQEALSYLSKLGRKQDDPLTTRLPVGNVSVEDIVREMLKPMLRDWLDRNLPPLVERLVEREVRRLARESDED